MRKIIVIGGVAAGMSAASKAARIDPNVQIVVYTQEEYISYSACSLPYLAQGIISDEGELIARTPEQMQKSGVQVLINHQVTGICPEKQTVQVRNSQGELFEDSYDELIIATGTRSMVPPFPNVELEGIFTVKTIPDIHKIQAYITAKDPKTAVVVGGGFIGLEMADALTNQGIHVTILEKAPQILTTFDQDMAQLVADHMSENGVEIHCGCSVESFSNDGNGRVCGVIADGKEYPADLVILSIGVIPNSEIAAAAGVELGVKKAILVDDEMRTNIPHIFAAGDCATARHIVTGKDVHIPLGTTANKQGRIAGENAAGGHKKFQGVTGASIFKIFQREAARTGLTMREAEMNGIDAWESTITSNTRASGYPGRGPITVKLVMRNGTNEILGGQIVGATGAGKRIDVLTAMVQLSATPVTLSQLDLAYAPPFSPVWDPLLVAANQAVSKASKR